MRTYISALFVPPLPSFLGVMGSVFFQKRFLCATNNKLCVFLCFSLNSNSFSVGVVPASEAVKTRFGNNSEYFSQNKSGFAQNYELHSSYLLENVINDCKCSDCLTCLVIGLVQ